MKKVQLSGSLRANVGKKGAKATRDAGLVPCVLYGQGEQTAFAVKANDIEKIVYSPDVFQVELDVDGKKAVGIIQELQQHPVKGTIQHVDFLELNDKKEVKVGLPVRLTGNSRGVLNGGRLMQIFRRLSIQALPADLPEAIVVDITNLRIGQAIRIKDIANDKVKFLDAANAVIVSVARSRVSVDEEEEAEAEEAAAEAAEGSDSEAGE
jgi:large subunit ribosomal protein L25|tara:strand:- start:25008 stop:25634 length:627 start_codon:yes stop_codon:yes gene_type:complete